MKDFIDRHGAARWALNFVLILAAFGLLGLVRTWAASDTRDARYDFCVEVEQVRTFARDAATRSLKSLPTIAYYRAHPQELAQATRDLERQVSFFSPELNCKEFAKL